MRSLAKTLSSLMIDDAWANPFVIFKRKPSVKWALREATSSFKKAIYNKPAANMTLDGEKMKTFSPKTRNKTKMSTLTIIQK